MRFSRRTNLIMPGTNSTCGSMTCRELSSAFEISKAARIIENAKNREVSANSFPGQILKRALQRKSAMGPTLSGLPTGEQIQILDGEGRTLVLFPCLEGSVLG